MARGSADYQRVVTLLGNIINKTNFTLTYAANVTLTSSFRRFLDENPATFHKLRNATAAEETSTFLFDLGSVKVVRSISITFISNATAPVTQNRIIIDFSEDNISFTELSNDNNTAGGDKIFDKSFGDTKFRYLRIRHVTEGTGDQDCKFSTIFMSE